MLALLGIVVHWLALWLAIYMASRRPRSKAAVLTGLAFLCGSIYLLKVAFYSVPSTAEGIVLREQWLGGWIAFTPAFLLHAFIVLTAFSARLSRWLLAIGYALAATVFVWGFFDGVFSEFGAVTLSRDGYLETLPAGRFYWVSIAQMVLTLGASLGVLIRARVVRSAGSKVVRRQLDVMIVGIALLTVGVAQVLVSGYMTAPMPDAVLFPVAIIGTVMLGVPLVRYSGRLGGQLLRSDARSSVLAVVIVLTLFAVSAMVAGARAAAVAGTGWLLVVMVTLGGQLRALGDRVFYGKTGRAARADLRTAGAYAGTRDRIDLEALSSEQTGGVVDYLSGLDRVHMAGAGGEAVDRQWLGLLARQEFEPVRRALDMPDGWTFGDPLPPAEVYRRMAAKLVPRERQALGLWYMGYSDKEMARLMDVKPGVPRSYLSEGKKKLGLSSGPSLMLFVRFSGFVGADALPLSEAAQAGKQGASREEERQG